MINLFNIIQYYKKLPHQKQALEYLQSIINKRLDDADIEQFYKLWRQNHVESLGYFIWMHPKRTNGKLVFNKQGLIEFNFDLMNSRGTRIDRVIVNSGAPSAQILLPAEKDFSGSLRPIPEGKWIIGKVEYNPQGWGPGLGQYWISLTPVNPKHNRTAIGIHLDENFKTSPGSAGCVTSYNIEVIKKIIHWIDSYNPGHLFVDYGISDADQAKTVKEFIRMHARAAVGYSEGNLTLQGRPTRNYYGHTDPGNNARNLGAFSYQGPASSPEEADTIWTDRLVRVIPSLLTGKLANIAKNPHSYPFIILNICDLYTQAPAAVTEPNGLIDQLTRHADALNIIETSVDIMVKLRVESFYDENKKLCAAGFNNDLNRLTADQRRRTQCCYDYVKTYL